MKKLTSKEIRKIWIDFFKSKGHLELESKSLIPVNDPSLLWINSGVATLKDYFSGKKIPPCPRLTNSQKCIRTNDIENVGVTARHHTFFEMLGNFSIGEYFKEQAIEFGYEFIFNVLEMPKDKIYMTYHGEDTKTYEKWISLGISKDHLILGNDDTNFWDVGSGPCGPDTEIFFDRGEKYDPEKIGIKLLKEDIENDRYVEIWNIVFSEFNNDGNDNYEELTMKNIDTGAGLERIASIFQDAPTNFDTDSFLPIIRAIEEKAKETYSIDSYFSNDKRVKEISKHFRIIADHMRAVTVAIQDGAVPSNNARGYIIRRLIRRAYRSAIKLGVSDNTFLYKLVPVVASVLDIYTIDIDKVSNIIEKEEIAFSKTIENGTLLLNEEMKKSKVLSSEVVFKLFETYGFPVELTEEIASENNIKLDLSKFEELKNKHSEVSRGQVFNGMEQQLKVLHKVDGKVSEFVGYEHMSAHSDIIVSEKENDKYYTLVSKTPFYATSGGQACDKGVIDGVEVIDVFKDKFGNHWHITNEEIKGKKVELVLHRENRMQAERNHSATHLLGKAMFEILGESRQRGSENSETKLRYDFPALEKPSAETISKIENKVREYIKAGYERKYILTTKEKAIEMGAIALEGEEYSEDVRVVDLGVSKEFCGGTHIQNTKLIEDFKITKVDSKGTGVFRIEAITSHKHIQEFNHAEKEKYLEIINAMIAKNKAMKPHYWFTVSTDLEKIKQQIEQVKEDSKAILKEMSNFKAEDILLEEKTINGQKALVNLEVHNAQILKSAGATLREIHKDSIIVLGSFDGEKHTIVVASNVFDSNEVLKQILAKYNGKGGGQKVFAMGSASQKIGEI